MVEKEIAQTGKLFTTRSLVRRKMLWFFGVFDWLINP